MVWNGAEKLDGPRGNPRTSCLVSINDPNSIGWLPRQSCFEDSAGSQNQEKLFLANFLGCPHCFRRQQRKMASTWDCSVTLYLATGRWGNSQKISGWAKSSAVGVWAHYIEGELVGIIRCSGWPAVPIRPIDRELKAFYVEIEADTEKLKLWGGAMYKNQN